MQDGLGLLTLPRGKFQLTDHLWPTCRAHSARLRLRTLHSQEMFDSAHLCSHTW